jgi:tetratricopeptide (TPR) repeat protein
MWIDPTAEYTEPGRLPWVDQGRLALIADAATTGLVATPESAMESEWSVQTTTVQLRENQKALMTVTRQDAGGMSDYFRAVSRQWQQMSNDQLKQAKELLAKTVQAESIVETDWGAPMDLTKPHKYSIRAEGLTGATATEQSAHAVIRQVPETPIQLLGLFREASQDVSAESGDKTRTEDYYLTHVFGNEERWRVVPPAGFHVKELPDVGDVPLGPITLRRERSEQGDGTVQIIYRMEFRKRRLTVAEARQFVKAYGALARKGGFRLDFEAGGTRSMSSGNWKEGITELRRDASVENPSESALLRYAGGLLDAGLRDKAVKVARHAVELFPKSASAYRQLSVALNHDAIGRANRPGPDLAEADRAMAKAVELDPKNKALAIEQAKIKELNAEGERYGNAASNEEAADLLKALEKELPALHEENSLADALFYARRFNDVKAFYEGEYRGSAAPFYLIGALAVLNGPEQAVRATATESGDQQQRRLQIENAAWRLTGIEQYAAAAGLYAEANRLGGKTGERDIRMIGRARPAATAAISNDPVIAVVQRYLLAVGDPFVTPHYDEYLAPQWKTLTRQSEVNEMVSTLSKYGQIVATVSGTRNQSAVAVGYNEFIKQGNDAIGYRVRIVDPDAKGSAQTIAWVVKSQDKYFVLGLHDDQAVVGDQALALAKAGDLAGARQWLDWEREEITHISSSDPLADEPFLSLWGLGDGTGKNTSKERIVAAAACQSARGLHFRDGLQALRDVRERVPAPWRNALDHALADGLSRHGEYAEAAPVWERLLKAYPTSSIALTSLGTALSYSGKLEEARNLAEPVKPTDQNFAAAVHVRSRAYLMEHKFRQAVDAMQELCNVNKCAGTDWNNLAWFTLFSPGDLKPDLTAAETAMRQSSQPSASWHHTLGSVQAELGKLKEARAELLLYLGRGAINDSAWYLEGRIAEGLGMTDIATGIYANIKRPERLTGDGAYELAQVRLRALGK